MAQATPMAGGTPAAGGTPTIVLVHGAWADATGFDPEIRALQRRGYTAIGFGNPLRDLAGDAAYLAEFLRTLSGPIVAGRPLAPADALAPSIVISHRLSQRLFNGPRNAVGAHLVLNSHDYVVVGVAGPAWNVPSWKTDVWQSVAFGHLITPQCCYVQLLGRLKPASRWPWRSPRTRSC